MKNLKFYFSAAISLLIINSFMSCSKDDPTPDIPSDELHEGIFFLNSGKIGGNNSTLDFFDFQDNKMYSGLFSEKNGRKLGDTANDMIIYGEKLYIAVSGSKTVEITSLDGTSLKQLHFDGDPRYLVADGAKVYVTLFNGYVARIDTESLEVEQTVKVGRNPEQITAANGKLYVANSGGLDYASEIGYDKTVSIIDIASFTELKKIEVAANPVCVTIDNDGDVYVASMGNYMDVPASFQRIDSNDNLTVIEGVIASEMASVGDIIYIISSQYDENWNPTIAFISFDTKQEKVLSTNFIEAGSEPANPYKINADPTTAHVFISSSDYVNTGDFYEFDADGKRVNQWETGLNPIKAVRVARLLQ